MYLKDLPPIVSETIGWSREWPQQKGVYWFCGYRFGFDQGEIPELVMVEVWCVANGLSYVAAGNFMYKSEGAVGLWKQVVPEIPVNFSEFQNELGAS